MIDTNPRPRFRARAWLLLPFALLLFALPVLMFGGRAGDLIDDTRAFFGAGTAAGVPTVIAVSCVGSRSGSNSSRGIGMTEYDCTIEVAAPSPPPQDDPFKTLPYDQAMVEWRRRTMAELKRVTDPANRFNRIERTLAINRTGTTPTLRRLSADGEPQRFGVVWSGWELATRWLQPALLSALFFGIGIAILRLARRVWRREA